ncbi:metal-sensitive transcriptional regulator [Amnibacterium kyonggiense]|uniref:DNA-binding FrmR family transcriptional regulator n=1 Tax=Amnibacterium kyonggiense TaxID=595671 RepID=A0A4V6Q111_9MICO|nr:metal-sensitive transcriptional regulator [Amnibacterium kyonggiense]TDS80294.1 DNA-binding FrmR family transcriptional regulator [Amnibacterium kyonggiense]
MQQITDTATDEARALRDQEAVRKVANRLKRAQGQLAAVIAAVENGGDCRDVVTQLAAVSSAIDRAGFAIISTAMRECLADAPAASTDQETRPSRLTVEELERLFLTLA